MLHRHTDIQTYRHTQCANTCTWNPHTRIHTSNRCTNDMHAHGTLRRYTNIHND